MKTANLQNQRQAIRLKAKSAIALSPQGICQVFNISNKGIRFKCIEEQSYPEHWSLDLYDINGQKLENLRVQKVWEKRRDKSKLSFSYEVGARFVRLSAAQKAQLKLFLRQLANRKSEVYE